MNKDTIQGNWQEFKGKVKKQWGKLTDDDMAQINGRREELLGRIQKRYGYEKDKAETELKRFEESCGCSGNHHSPENDKLHSRENDKLHSHEHDQHHPRENEKEKAYAKSDRNTHSH